MKVFLIIMALQFGNYTPVYHMPMESMDACYSKSWDWEFQNQMQAIYGNNIRIECKQTW